MKTIEFRSTVTEFLYAQLEAARGRMELDEFLVQLVTIGWTHFQEEVNNQQRAQSYDVLAVNTGKFSSMLEKLKIDVAPAAVAKPANVSTFGSDMTSRRNAG